MDKGVSSGRLTVNTESECPGGYRHGLVQEVNHGPTYFSREFYREIKGVDELKEIVDPVIGTRPRTYNVINIRTSAERQYV